VYDYAGDGKAQRRTGRFVYAMLGINRPSEVHCG
jgi:hypothetical protein